MNESDALRLTKTLLAVVLRWPTAKIFPLLDLLRCLVFWRPACQLIFSPAHWQRIVESSVTRVGLPAINALIVLRLLANAVAVDGPRFLDSPQTHDPYISAIAFHSTRDFAKDCLNSIKMRKRHQVALATLIHNFAVLYYEPYRRRKVARNTIYILQLPVLCIRTALQVLNLAPEHGPSGVALFHPDAIFTLLVTLGTVLNVGSQSDNSSEEELKDYRIRILDAYATDILLQDVDTRRMDKEESTILSWGRVKKLLKYWLDTEAVSPKVQSCVASLLQILE